MKNKIGWCSMTFNPCWGCLNNSECREYCYARKIAKRFCKVMAEKEDEYHFYFEDEDVEICSDLLASRLKHFQPTLLRSQFDKKFPKKSQRIFVGSMSEIAHWEKRWMEVVLGRILCYPQHIFQFLTRHPDIYLKYNFPDNCWLGITITKEDDINKNDWRYFYENTKYFISFEPLLEDVNSLLKFLNYSNISWVIVGAETGNRKDKIIPKKEWIEDIVEYCRRLNIPIYLKDSLKNIYPVEIKEFPKNNL